MIEQRPTRRAGSSPAMRSHTPRTESERSVKPSRKLRRFESSTRHTQRVRPLTSTYAVRGRSCPVQSSPAESGCLRLVVGRSWAGGSRVSGASRRRRPAHRGAGTPPAPPSRDRREARQPRWRRRGWVCSARPGSTAGGHPGAGVPPPEVSLVGARRWQRAQRAVRREQRRMITTDVRNQGSILCFMRSAWTASRARCW